MKFTIKKVVVTLDQKEKEFAALFISSLVFIALGFFLGISVKN